MRTEGNNSIDTNREKHIKNKSNLSKIYMKW